MKRIFVLGAAAALSAGSCLAQSININFAPVGTEGPSSSYGGAGPAGYWNVISGPTAENLRAIDGSLTNVPNFAQAPMVAISQTLPGPTGDDALLLDSYITLIDVMVHVNITGLENGDYNVIFYGLNSGNASTGFSIDPNFDFTSGAWTGQLETGRTHVMLPAVVTDGTLNFGMVGSIFGLGHFAGMQIVQVPGPGAGVVLMAGGLVAGRRRRRV